MWKQLSFFALVKPKGDILPVRTVYSAGHNKRTQNIGLNYLNAKTPVWYAAPDLIASRILTDKSPPIHKAIRMVSGNSQKSLETTNLGGMVEIKPAETDFYRTVIEQRVSHKKTNKALADFLKVLANSGSYGLFVEVNTERKKKEMKVSYFSGEEKGRVASNYVEKPGAWYFPPLANPTLCLLRLTNLTARNGVHLRVSISWTASPIKSPCSPRYIRTRWFPNPSESYFASTWVNRR